MLFRVCPLTMRTKAILLVRDAALLLEKLENPGWCLKYVPEFELIFRTVQRRG